MLRRPLTACRGALLGLALCFTSAALFADGTETLGPASIPIEQGTGLVSAGTGLFTQPGSVTLDVPADASVRQVIVYWTGYFTDNVATEGDDEILVNGNAVQGTSIGGPLFLVPGLFVQGYRADITSLGIVVPGSNTITFDGMDFGWDDPDDPEGGDNGASIFAIIDDGSPLHTIDFRDGVDFAFGRQTGDQKVCVPQVYSFPPAPVERIATLTNVVSDVEPVDRPNHLYITMDGVLTDIYYPWASRSGHEWDHHEIEVTIPAGVSEMTVEAVSATLDGTARKPASLTWGTSALNVPEVPEMLGEIGDLVYCDEDLDGVKDDGEPGIPDVDVLLICAGDDGLLDTPDDVTRTETTGADGSYLFSDVPAGLCRVEVDAATGPADKVLGQCPPIVDIDLAAGESYLDADFCFVSLPNCDLSVEAGCNLVDEPDDGNDCDGKISRLVLRYTADDCSASSHSQSASVVYCRSVDAPLPDRVYIVATDKSNPHHRRAKIWFRGMVELGDTYTLTGAASRHGVLKGDTRIFVYDRRCGRLLQVVRFHTSCSEPVNVGDQHGAHLITSITSTRGGTVDTAAPSGPAADPMDHCDIDGPSGRVLYTYAITNESSLVEATNVQVVDDVFGEHADSPIASILPGETVILTFEVDIDEDTTSTVTVTAQPGDCSASGTTVVDVDENDGSEGCSHGYWKNCRHFDEWTRPYCPRTPFGRVFENAFRCKSLYQVLWLRGGGLNALGRETVAALLNAASPDVDFGMTPDEVIAAFNDVYPGSARDYEELKDHFEALNTRGCPLN